MNNAKSPASAVSPALEVNIAKDLALVDVMHYGQKVTVMRNQNQENLVNSDFAKIEPMTRST